MDDNTIVELYLCRNEAAIWQTSKKFGSRLQSLAYGIVNDSQTAEECENSTYMEAWNTIPPHEPRSYLYAYLARITRHIYPLWIKRGAMAACFCLVAAGAFAASQLPYKTIRQENKPAEYSSESIVPEFYPDESQDIETSVFNEATAAADADAVRKYIPGYFTEELNNDELIAIEPKKKTSDMKFSGFAGFDGNGTLIDVCLDVTAPFLTDSVTVYFSYDYEGPSRCYELPGDSLEQAKKDFSVILDCFSYYEDDKPDLSSILADNIPEFIDQKLTLAEAQEDVHFGMYMPSNPPGGFTEESIRRYKDQNNDYLLGLWTKGYDEIQWKIYRFNDEAQERVTGIADTTNYDLSLYPIPRASSVPDELQSIVDNPVFLAEELTLDAVMARAYKIDDAGDSDDWRMRFSVKYDDIVIEVRTKGMEPEWVYQQLQSFVTK